VRLTEAVSLSAAKNTTKTVPLAPLGSIDAQREHLKALSSTNLIPISAKSPLKSRAEKLAKDSGLALKRQKTVDAARE